MRIKRIEIIGFKSFCDRAVLNFSEPVTGVVGPNGCGKSNIVDAIRWCMGEQSAKHLRGQAMNDVIFAGSDSREPAGMAEVSLTFEDVGFSTETLAQALDTDEQKLARQTETMAEPEPAAEPEPEPETKPDAAAEILEERPPAIDYSQYSEVTITRRLFRDGTSQYLLNKTLCRLRDVTDFFLGTGVGTKAYSIIEQGRIGMIVSSRASERRHIIEEAAGITKFKVKKRAAERKLEQTRQNLLRVTDIVAELEARLGTLRRQAQKAERYRRYRAEVKDIELHVAAHGYLGLLAEEKHSRVTQRELAEQLAASRAELEALEAGVVAERAELSVEERRLGELSEQIYELDNQIKLSESKIEYQRREAGELSERAAAAHREIVELGERRSQADGAIDRQREGLGELESELGDLSAAAADRDAAFASARIELARTEADLDRARKELAAARADKHRAESQRELLESRVGDAERRLARVLAETEEHNRRAALLGRDVKRLELSLSRLRQQRLDLGHRTESIERRRDELEKVTGEAESEVAAIRDRLHRRRSRLQSLIEIHDKYEGFARGTRAVMQRRDELGNGAIAGLVADVMEVPERFETAIEAVLGERLGGILVDRVDVGLAAINFLKESGAGRSSFVVVDGHTSDEDVEPHSGGQAVIIGRAADLVRADPGYRELVEMFLGDVVVVSDLAQALELHAAGIGGPLVTLGGDVVDRHGVVSGGSPESASGVLAQKREIRELEDECAALEGELAAGTARLVSSKSELKRVSATLISLKTETHDGELAITAQEKDLAGARAELERLRGQRARLNAEQLELEELTSAASAERARLEAADSDAIARIESGERAVESLGAALANLRDAVDQASAAVTEAKVRVAKLGEQRASVEASAARLENERRELAGRMERLESQIDGDTNRAAALLSEAEGIEAELESVRARRREHAEALTEGRQDYDARQAAVGEAELAMKATRSRTEALSSEVTAVEMKMTNVEIEKRHLEASTDERYHLHLPAVLGDYHLRPPVTGEDRERLTQRKRLIDRMGSDINLTAIDEYAEISERHEFLAAQKIDLESAVGQLERAIAKINKVSRKLFKDTFDAVNAEFSAVFPRLFHGGRARLALTPHKGATDGSIDVLEAGVEIMAQPPGKKNTTVDQLSGGEKALTAVALLFAIFLIKPSPFCLLDEVDAPLDDANVDRYNAILREMTDRSQFIVITHNKRTMEITDRLYGVTMQEPGVSKLVTVNLTRIGEGDGDGDFAAA